MSVVSVLGTLITAIMVWLFGVVFELAGFDAALETQPDSVIGFLNISYILIPCICLIAGALALKVFPINKRTFASLTAALELRNRGESYSQYDDDLAKILGHKK